MTEFNRAISSASQAPSPEPLARFQTPAVEAIIRELGADDIRMLEWHGGEDLRSFYETQWARHCNGEVSVLVVDWNGTPVAQAAVHWQGKPTHPHIPDIQSVRVFPAFRRLGVGTQLLAACERLVAAKGFDKVSLAVGTANPHARKLYERVGYQAVGQLYDDEWSYTDASGEVRHISETVIDMVKELR